MRFEQSAAASGLREAVAKAAERIGQHPAIGTVRNQVLPEPYRFLSLTGFPYVVVYNPDRDPLQQRRHAEHCAFDMKAGLALAEFDRVRKHRPEHEIQTDAHDLHADEEQLGCEGAVELDPARLPPEREA